MTNFNFHGTISSEGEHIYTKTEVDNLPVAFSADECTDYTSDSPTRGCTPAAVKKAISEVVDPKPHEHDYLPLSGGTLIGDLQLGTGGPILHYDSNYKCLNVVFN